MKSETPEQVGEKTAGRLRGLLLAVFLLGAVGTAAELLLLGHYEEIWQLVPLLLITVSLTVVGMWLMSHGRSILRVFQLSMLLCLAAGALGVFLHYRSNVEFELEMNPRAAGAELIWESLTGAMPALAPGTMFHLGLVGLLYTYRHPALRSLKQRSSSLEAHDEI
jgi:hypothetical protein